MIWGCEELLVLCSGESEWSVWELRPEDSEWDANTWQHWSVNTTGVWEQLDGNRGEQTSTHPLLFICGRFRRENWIFLSCSSWGMSKWLERIYNFSSKFEVCLGIFCQRDMPGKHPERGSQEASLSDSETTSVNSFKWGGAAAQAEPGHSDKEPHFSYLGSLFFFHGIHIMTIGERWDVNWALSFTTPPCSSWQTRTLPLYSRRGPNHLSDLLPPTITHEKYPQILHQLHISKAIPFWIYIHFRQSSI